MADDEKLDGPPVPWLHGAAGITAGAISMTMFYPLDLIRTRLHAQTGEPSTKMKTPMMIVRAEGIRGLYKGVKIAVASHSIGWGLYLTVFRTFQQRFARQWGDSSAGDFVAACCAAVFTATMVTPLNVLKTRTQLREDKVKSSVTRRLRAIVAKEGLPALLKGVGPQICLSSHTTIQVALYECIKRRMWDKSDAPMLGVALASGLSKAVAATICNPLEVVKTRLQDQRNASNPGYASMRAAFRTIYANEGMKGFYRGVGVNVLRVVPSTMTAFVLYEQVLRGAHAVHVSVRSPAKTAVATETAAAAAVTPTD